MLWIINIRSESQVLNRAFIPRRLNDYSPVSDNEKLWHNWVKSIELECRVIVTVDPLAPIQELDPRVLQEWVDKEQTYVDRPTKDEGVVYKTLCFLPKSKLIYHRKQKRWYHLFICQIILLFYFFYHYENSTIYDYATDRKIYRVIDCTSGEEVWYYPRYLSQKFFSLFEHLVVTEWNFRDMLSAFWLTFFCFLMPRVFLVKWLLDFFCKIYLL